MSARVPRIFALACSAPPPALESHPLKQSPQQPSSWRLLGACCIPCLQVGRYFLRPKLVPSLCLPLRSKCLLHRLHGPNVYPFSSRRINIASKTYTFGGENVYVSSVKRIRLGHETYTFCPGNVYVLLPQAFRFVNVWCSESIEALPLSPRQPLHNEATRRDAIGIASGGFILGRG